MLTDTLRTLIERAERNGQAVKRVREGAVIGNGFYGDPKQTPLIDQWRVTVVNHDKKMGDWQVMHVDHYGTEIACIKIEQGKAELVNYYGQSYSDRNALNGLCGYYGLPHRFRYLPSKHEFKLIS